MIRDFDDIAGFQAKQQEAIDTLLLNPKCKYLLYGGAAGGGKSYFLRWAAVKLALYYASKYGIRNVPIGVFCEDYPTLRDRQITKMKREFPRWLGELKETKDEGYAFFVDPKWGGGLILLRNLDDPSKYASVEFAAELVDELTKNSNTTFEDLRFRLRFPGISDPKFVAASNPGGIGHGFVKKLWITPDDSSPDVEQERFFYIPAFYSDNKYIDPDYVKQLDALSEDKRKAFKEGSWDVFAGQYFTEFSAPKHVVNSFLPSFQYLIIGGMDWGRTAPFAFYLTAIERVKFEGINFLRATTFLEIYGTQHTPKEWSIQIKQECRRFKVKLEKVDWIRGDPSMFTKAADNSISIADQFYKHGVRVLPASNDRVGGWENMHDWLSMAPDGIPYWQITKNCKNLIRTLPELVHDENKVEDVDSGGEDHAGDAARYQFKHLKWIDGKVGGVGGTKPKPPSDKFTAVVENGKQVSIDLSRWARPKRRIFYPNL